MTLPKTEVFKEDSHSLSVYLSGLGPLTLG